jgi:hypothetical protein
MNSIVLIGSVGKDIEYLGLESKRTSYADVINFDNVNECINVEFFNLGV